MNGTHITITLESNVATIPLLSAITPPAGDPQTVRNSAVYVTRNVAPRFTFSANSTYAPYGGRGSRRRSSGRSPEVS